MPSLRGIRTPSKVAKLVMEQTDHMMLAGEGAQGFAKARGEENIRVCGAHTVVENMRRGMTPKEAVLDALKRVARNFDNDLKRLEAISLYFYALRKDGEYAGASLWGRASVQGRPAQFAVCAGEGESHQEASAFLCQRG